VIHCADEGVGASFFQIMLKSHELAFLQDLPPLQAPLLSTVSINRFRAIPFLQPNRQILACTLLI